MGGGVEARWRFVRQTILREVAVCLPTLLLGTDMVRDRICVWCTNCCPVET